MSSVAPHPREQPFGAPYWAFTALLIANVAADIWMPDSTIARLVSYAFLASGAIWFGLRVRTGYRRRRPYWTRESWLRYGRLAAMPVAAIVFALAMIVVVNGPRGKYVRTDADGYWNDNLLALPFCAE